MRALLLLFLLPAAAHASVDFKCDSAGAVVGWLHFGYAGANGSVQLETWAGYPPASLVDANLDAGQAIAPGGVRFTSDADRTTGEVALVDVPVQYLTSDKFTAKVVLGKSRLQLNCIRH